MDKTKIRVIIILFVILGMGGSLFLVLYTDEQDRFAKADRQKSEYLQALKESDQARKEYFDQVASKRAEYQAEMERSKAEYDALLKKQPDAIKANQKTVTKIVERPVTKTETVQVTKPTSTRKTKTS